MKHTTTVYELQGMHDGPNASAYLISSTGDFITRGVLGSHTFGCGNLYGDGHVYAEATAESVSPSILYNMTKGISGFVQAITSTTILAENVPFSPGDFFIVTLPLGWTRQTVDGPVIEVECNVCGFSYPSKLLSRGKCKVCQDEN